MAPPAPRAGQAGQGTTAYEGEGKQGRRGEGYPPRWGSMDKKRARGASDYRRLPRGRGWEGGAARGDPIHAASPWSTWGRSSPRTRRGSTPRRTSLPVGVPAPPASTCAATTRTVPARGGSKRFAAARGDDEGKPLFRLSADEGLDEPHRRQVGHCGLGGGARGASRRSGGPAGRTPKKTAISGPRVLRLLPPSHPSSHRRTAGGEGSASNTSLSSSEASPSARRHPRRKGSRRSDQSRTARSIGRRGEHDELSLTLCSNT